MRLRYVISVALLWGLSAPGYAEQPRPAEHPTGNQSVTMSDAEIEIVLGLLDQACRYGGLKSCELALPIAGKLAAIRATRASH